MSRQRKLILAALMCAAMPAGSVLAQTVTPPQHKTTAAATPGAPASTAAPPAEKTPDHPPSTPLTRAHRNWPGQTG